MAAVPSEKSVQTGKRRHRLAYWMVLALAIHLELGVGLALWAYFYAPRSADVEGALGLAGDETVDLQVLDEDAARKIIAAFEKEQEALEEEKRKEEINAKKPPGQVVELAKPTREERPEDARFAAEHDSKVEKQTKKFGELDPEATQGRSDGRDPVTTPAVKPQQARPEQKGSEGEKRSRILAMRSPEPSPREPRPPGRGPEDVSGQSSESEPGYTAGDGRELSTGQPAPPEETPGGGAPMPAVPGAAPLVPTPQQVARAIGSGTRDHLDGVAEGEETALNAKKWKFASFFNRVKRQVRSHWDPADEYRKRDPTFRIYGQKDRYTLLRVELKSDGSLANVALETPSGVEFLDDEAIEAFKLAQPFPNPPHQLVENGLISFRFGFYFEIGDNLPRFKVFRYDEF